MQYVRPADRRETRVMRVVVWVAVGTLAQEPATRAEALRLKREAKAEQLTPPEYSRLERALVWLENGRILERLLSPPVGLYPILGSITSGGGFAMGPGWPEAVYSPTWACGGTTFRPKNSSESAATPAERMP